MTLKLTELPLRTVERNLAANGFINAGKNKHLIYKHPDGRRAVISCKRPNTVNTNILTAIIREAKLTREQFLSPFGAKG